MEDDDGPLRYHQRSGRIQRARREYLVRDIGKPDLLVGWEQPSYFFQRQELYTDGDSRESGRECTIVTALSNLPSPGPSPLLCDRGSPRYPNTQDLRQPCAAGRPG